jgi:hypothetical protein
VASTLELFLYPLLPCAVASLAVVSDILNCFGHCNQRCFSFTEGCIVQIVGVA